MNVDATYEAIAVPFATLAVVVRDHSGGVVFCASVSCCLFYAW